MKSEKKETTKGIELPNQEKIRTLEEKENYKEREKQEKYLDLARELKT